jgi:hypothetical protein
MADVEEKELEGKEVDHVEEEQQMKCKRKI